MPKLEIDYSNTIIYKITCKDKSIKEIYVGHTTNFVQRKYTHKQSCNNNYNSKLYNIIRNNGGWNNWEMIMLEFFNCKNSIEARIKEQEYYEKLQATLNSVEPLPQKKQILSNDNITQIEMFSCKRCGYSTIIKGDFNKHLHRKTPCKSELSDIDILILYPEFFLEEKYEKKNICEFCLKGFTFASCKSIHKKKCAVKLLQEDKQKQIEKDLENKQIQMEKQLEDQEKKIANLEKTFKSNRSKTINNNITNNNTTNNINLNIFGKENLNFLISEPNFKKFMMRCLTNTDTGYIQLMDKIYFNEAHPENMSIKKTNSKDDFVKCFNGTSWDVMYSNSALEIIMDRLSSAFYVFFDWIEENEEERVKSEIIKTFMKEVGNPLNLDFTGYNYDFLYDKEDTQTRKKKKILQKFCVLNIYNKSKGDIPF